MKLTIPLDPLPASRPRVTRRGFAYYAEPYKSYKAELKKWLEENYKGEKITVPITIKATFVAEQPKSTKLPFPKPDVDNYAKALLDAMNDVAMEDDWLVLEGTFRKEWAPKGKPGYIKVEVELV